MESWYLLYCKRGQLSRAQKHLKWQAVNCFSPIITLEKIVRGKRIAISEPLFPNRGVSHFVRFGALPATIPYRVIEELQIHVGETCVDPQTPQPGDTVLIVNGVFEGLRAIYTEPDGETRSMLLLNLLHKQVSQSLDNRQFQKV
ncbi:transcriptional activator RfaH [Serratia symbiotica]|uniref:Transcription/translation regulatory transformer protein RfaH n=1 Tax=Serratia symbiotica TaxID=138074 RepID=A0A068Z6H2_9GAMM|nr:transcription/translation regulatory transformer protein RfaH [Serratia symbiotica]QLH64226.1 transcription/translation regulatory transformer protein RfaH [Serratia symbiotica]CDS56724.1 DNA-binding transcriptional antiterminator [Serratia symbiotica]